jgi:hypothetical protein
MDVKTGLVRQFGGYNQAFLPELAGIHLAFSMLSPN